MLPLYCLSLGCLSAVSRLSHTRLHPHPRHRYLDLGNSKVTSQIAEIVDVPTIFIFGSAKVNLYEQSPAALNEPQSTHLAQAGMRARRTSTSNGFASRWHGGHLEKYNHRKVVPQPMPSPTDKGLKPGRRLLFSQRQRRIAHHSMATLHEFESYGRCRWRSSLKSRLRLRYAPARQHHRAQHAAYRQEQQQCRADMRHVGPTHHRKSRHPDDRHQAYRYRRRYPNPCSLTHMPRTLLKPPRTPGPPVILLTCDFQHTAA